MGCSLAARLVALKKELKRHHNPGYLFVEPSEMVVTQELKDVMSMGRRDIAYETGPFITLLNGQTFESLWEERSFLMMGHIRQADRVAVTHADLLDEDRMHHIRDVLKADVHELLPLSVPRDKGVEKIIAAIVNQP
ncbi:MAG: hypothetical protein AB7S77_10335 [Desulfatirhabdiaceae bacterium]